MIKCLILLCLSFYSINATAGSYEDNAFKTAAIVYNVDENILRAICWQESLHDSKALNDSDGGPEDHAFGICQILYSTAVKLGVKDEKCKNVTSKTPTDDRVYANCKLFGPKTNIYLAAKLLRSLKKKYNGDMFKAVAAYNTGSYKVCKDGWLYYKGKQFKRCVKGGPVNLYYVLRVFDAIKKGR